MSLSFSDTTNFKGLVQLFEREIGASRTDVSGNTNRLKEFAADANLALDSYLRMAFPAEGKWKLDDSNHSDYPEITTNLVANQRSYLFTSDENGNLLLDIYKVYVKVGSAYVEISPVDADKDANVSSFTDGLNTTGTVSRYDKTANAILLDPIPSSNVSSGLKVSINREASYFTYTDTTKKPGFAGIHHSYFFLKPAEDYARRNNLTSYPRIQNDIMKLEREITEFYGHRAKDENQSLYINIENNR